MEAQALQKSCLKCAPHLRRRCGHKRCRHIQIAALRLYRRWDRKRLWSWLPPWTAGVRECQDQHAVGSRGEAYISREVGRGRMIDPLPDTTLPLHTSRFEVIPKPHQPGKFCLILDLSHPKGWSVNDGIEPKLCSMQYTSVKKVVKKINGMKPGVPLT